MPRTQFPTALGPCELTWSDTGLTGFYLPKTSQKNSPRPQPAAESTARPRWIRQLIEDVQRHLEGQPQDFSAVPLDWSKVSSFQQAVYQQVRTIRPGMVNSYGEIARHIGFDARAARSIGVAMAKNPWPLIVPCHRVISAAGKMTGYSAAGGIRMKTRLLVLEGAELISE